MYKVIYLKQREENNQTIYNKTYTLFLHKRDAESFIERVRGRFISVQYIEHTSREVAAQV